jgi:hypothetical protein
MRRHRLKDKKPMHGHRLKKPNGADIELHGEALLDEILNGTVWRLRSSLQGPLTPIGKSSSSAVLAGASVLASRATFGSFKAADICLLD